jgi:hypothetical protein
MGRVALDQGGSRCVASPTSGALRPLPGGSPHRVLRRKVRVVRLPHRRSAPRRDQERTGLATHNAQRSPERHRARTRARDRARAQLRSNNIDVRASRTMSTGYLCIGHAPLLSADRSGPRSTATLVPRGSDALMTGPTGSARRDPASVKLPARICGD